MGSENSFSTVILPGIVTSLLAAIIAGVFVRGWRALSNADRRGQLTAHLFLATAILCAPASFYLAWQTRVIADTPPIGSVYSIALPIVQVAIFLVLAMMRPDLLRSRAAPSYHKKEIRIQVRKPERQPYDIGAHVLSPGTSMLSRGVVPIDWDTLVRGSEILAKQHEDCCTSDVPDLCVGVNSQGLAIASVFAVTRIGHSPIPIGLVRCRGSDHEVDEERSVLPSSGTSIRRVLVADFEVKTGKALRNVCTLLRARYPGIEIRTAVLAASSIREPSAFTAMAGLRESGFAVQEEFLPDFLAFLSPRKVRLARGMG